MDYEKAYKEALRKAKETLEKSSAKDAARMVVEHFFPQLCESEDEKARKGLINFLNQQEISNRITFEAKQFWLAYLEKQKENPKTADSIPSNCTSDAKCEDRSPKHSDSDGTDICDTPAYWRGWDDAMKQKEQKPHLELKAGKWYICHRAFCARADHLTVKEGERFQCEKDGIVKGFVIKEPEKYFKECGAPAPMEDEQKEQKPEYPLTPDECIKPAEWSEVELTFRGEKIKVKRPFYRDDKGSGYSTTEQDDWVAWDALRSWAESHGYTPFDLYPRAEWSEEDEEVRRQLICVLSGGIALTTKETRSKMLEWLKSLRPSWKPSELHLSALLAVFNDPNNIDSQTCQLALTDLYEQLKKL